MHGRATAIKTVFFLVVKHGEAKIVIAVKVAVSFTIIIGSHDRGTL